MNLTFKKLKIHNFMSIGDATLDLNDLGFVTIIGNNLCKTDTTSSNGSGKSSILESIVWCITGDTIRGTKDVVNNVVGGDCVVSINFDVDDKSYDIIRSRGSSSSLTFKVDGEDISGKGIRDTEKIINDYLPDLNYNLINSAIILGQGLPNKFTNNTPSGRKEILETLTKSDFMIKDLKERLSQRTSEIQEVIAKTTESIRYEEGKMNVLQQSISDEEIRLSADSYEDILSDLIDKKNKLAEEIRINKSKKDSLSEKYNDYRNKWLSLNESKSSIRSEIEDKYASTIEDKSKKVNSLKLDILCTEKALSDKEKIVDVCPTCGQKLVGVVKPDTTEDRAKLTCLREQYRVASEELDSTLRMKNDELESNIKSLSDAIELNKSNSSRLDDELNEADKLVCKNEYDLRKIEGDIEHMRRWMLERDSKLKDLESKKVELKSIQDRVDHLKESRDKFGERLSILSKFNTLTNRDFRGVLISGIVEYIDRKAKDFSSAVLGTDLIDIGLDGNNLNISYAKKLYESLSGGEQKKVDIIVQLAIRDMMCKYMNFSSNIIALDEIFDALDKDGCQRVIDFISNELSDIGSVFIVSHRDDLQLPYDKEILVTKRQDGISYIQ